MFVGAEFCTASSTNGGWWVSLVVLFLFETKVCWGQKGKKCTHGYTKKKAPPPTFFIFR